MRSHARSGRPFWVSPSQQAIIAAIARLAAETALPAGLTPDELRRRQKIGFLISDYSIATYQRHAEKRQLLAILVGSNLASFLLGYHSDNEIEAGDSGSSFIREAFGSEAAIIKQIATAPAFFNHGHARTLYRFFQADVKADTYAAIVKTPRNEGSEDFHSRLGFKERAVFMHPDGRLRGIWGQTHALSS